MVKFQGFKALTFQPHLYNRLLKKDLQHLQDKQSNQLILNFEAQQLIEQGMLKQDKQPSIYLYEQEFKGFISLGILGQLSVKDYINKRIKKHQETLNRQEQNLNQDTITQKNLPPVVVGHRNNQKIDEILMKIKQSKKPFAVWKSVDQRKHRLWKIKQYKEIEQIFNNQVESLYILDGHHRFEAMGKHLQKQEKQVINQKDQWIMGILYSNKYIKVYSQYRELVDEDKNFIKDILQNTKFNVKEQNQFCQQKMKKDSILMIENGKIYQISNNNKDNQNKLGVEVLFQIIEEYQNKKNKQQNWQEKQFKIKIKYVPSILMDLKDQIKNQKNPIFILKPPQILKIFEYGDKSLTLPPKSTWLQPKPSLHMIVRLPYATQ